MTTFQRTWSVKYNYAPPATNLITQARSAIIAFKQFLIGAAGNDEAARAWAGTHSLGTSAPAVTANPWVVVRSCDGTTAPDGTDQWGSDITKLKFKGFDASGVADASTNFSWMVLKRSGVMPGPGGATGTVYMLIALNGTQIYKWTIRYFHRSWFIGDATNATPIAVATTASHGYASGESAVIAGVGGNTATNGTFTITVTDGTHFTLGGSVGNGAYAGGGYVTMDPSGGSTTALPTGATGVNYDDIQYIDTTADASQRWHFIRDNSEFGFSVWALGCRTPSDRLRSMTHLQEIERFYDEDPWPCRTWAGWHETHSAGEAYWPSIFNIGGSAGQEQSGAFDKNGVSTLAMSQMCHISWLNESNQPPMRKYGRYGTHYNAKLLDAPVYEAWNPSPSSNGREGIRGRWIDVRECPYALGYRGAGGNTYGYTEPNASPYASACIGGFWLPCAETPEI